MKVIILLVSLLLIVSCTYDVVDETHVFKGDVNVSQDLYVGGNITYGSHFASVFYNNISNPITINFTGVNAWATIVGYQLVNTRGVVVSGNATVNRSGFYKVASHIAFSGGNNGDYELSLFVNDVMNSHCSLFRTTTSTGIGSASFSCIDFYNEGDSLNMRVRDTTSPVQSTVFYFINFNMVELI